MATVKEINLGDTSNWNKNPLHTSSEQDDTADVERKKKKKKKRNRNNRRTASEHTILDQIKNHDVTFCKLIGCYGIILLLQTLIFSIFYFSLFYLFTYPNFSNTEKEGVIVFVIFGILFVLLFVYALVRWKHRALAMIKKRIGSHSRRTDNLVVRIKNLYSTNFGLNGKYYLYKLYGSETLEKIFQTTNYFTLYICRLPLSITMFFCVLYFLDSGLQAFLLYKKIVLPFCSTKREHDSASFGIITVAERDRLVNIDIIMDTIYLMFPPLFLFFYGHVAPATRDLLQIIIMPSLSLFSKLRSQFFENIARKLDDIVIKKENQEAQKIRRRRLSVSYILDSYVIIKHQCCYIRLKPSLTIDLYTRTHTHVVI